MLLNTITHVEGLEADGEEREGYVPLEVAGELV
jgi:hypothetical protein